MFEYIKHFYEWNFNIARHTHEVFNTQRIRDPLGGLMTCHPHAGCHAADNNSAHFYTFAPSTKLVLGTSNDMTKRRLRAHIVYGENFVIYELIKQEKAPRSRPALCVINKRRRKRIFEYILETKACALYYAAQGLPPSMLTPRGVVIQSTNA